MLTEDDKIKLEQSLDDALLRDGRTSLEQTSDQETNIERVLQNAIMTSVKRVHENELRQELKSLLPGISLEADAQHETHKNSDRRIWYAAAAVILIGVSAYFLFWNNSTTAERVFATYYKPFAAIITTRGDHAGVYPSGVKEYQNGHYEAAVVSLQTALTEQPDAAQAAYINLLLGNCDLQLKRNADALLRFREATRSPDAIMKSHATWFEAITLIRLNRKQEAAALLRAMKASHGAYETMATQAAADLEKIPDERK